MRTSSPPVPLLVTDANGIVTAANPAARELLGPALGHNCRSLVQARTLAGIGVCANCEHYPPDSDEERYHGTVDIRGEVVDLRCSVVGNTRVIAMPEGEPEREPVLSPREREVLVLVARGLTNEKIAERLGVATSTVRTHMEHLLEKLGVRSRSQAVARALSLGEIE